MGRILVGMFNIIFKLFTGWMEGVDENRDLLIEELRENSDRIEI